MKETKWIFAAGMRRSGSTVQYNIARDLLIAMRDNENIMPEPKPETSFLFAGFVTWQNFDALYKANNSKYDYILLKSHVYIPDYSTTAKGLVMDSGRVVVLSAHRDLRDVAASLMKWQKDMTWKRIMYGDGTHHGELNAVMNEHNSWHSSVAQQYLHDSNYKFILNSLPCEVTRIAAKIGINGVMNELRDEIAIDNSLHNVEAYIDKMKGAWDGANTLYHKAHIQSGEIGRYKAELTKGQIADVEYLAHDWLTRKGYL